MSVLLPTADGDHAVALAERHAADAWARAADHDRDGTFPAETFDEMRESGLLGLFVPTEVGGLGLGTVADWVAVTNRLGRGDGSTAIAANMHLGATYALLRAHQAARCFGLDDVAAAVERKLAASRSALLCAPHTERGTALHQPRLAATPIDGGWQLDGRKLFATMSPVASALVVTARIDGDEPRTAVATVPLTTPGVTVEPTWDAMGMRASGSHDVVFDGCRLPREAVLVGGAWGELGPDTKLLVAAQVSALLAVFVGIAEQARDVAVSMVTTNRRGPAGLLLAEREGTRRLAADVDVAVRSAQSMLASTVRAVDEYAARHPMGCHEVDELQELFAQFLATKLVVNRACIDAVDGAMTMVGGAGYLSGHPLSRLYRDVRAGPPMQPGPVECWSYLGHAALEMEADTLLA